MLSTTVATTCNIGFSSSTLGHLQEDRKRAVYCLLMNWKLGQLVQNELVGRGADFTCRVKYKLSVSVGIVYRCCTCCIQLCFVIYFSQRTTMRPDSSIDSQISHLNVYRVDI